LRHVVQFGLCRNWTFFPDAFEAALVLAAGFDFTIAPPQ
jgi:hypothetical protein